MIKPLSRNCVLEMRAMYIYSTHTNSSSVLRGHKSIRRGLQNEYEIKIRHENLQLKFRDRIYALKTLYEREPRMHSWKIHQYERQFFYRQQLKLSQRSRYISRVHCVLLWWHGKLQNDINDRRQRCHQKETNSFNDVHLNRIPRY